MKSVALAARLFGFLAGQSCAWAAPPPHLLRAASVHNKKVSRQEVGASLLETGASSAVQASAEALEAQCFVVPTTLCIEDEIGRTFSIARSYFPPDLLLWYQFDQSLPTDDSGQMRHLTDHNFALTPLQVGPGIMGRGGSASFDGSYYRTMRAAKALDSQAFTVMLWVYLRQDSIGAWRTIFSRGSEVGELLPALLLYPDERRLHVRVSPKVDAGVGTQLDSQGVLPLKRWSHIAITCTGSVLRLYINGVEDGHVIMEAPPPASEGSSLHLGRDPWRAGIKAFLDDFRWYSRVMPADEIRAVLYPGLTGTAGGGGAVSLSCLSCRFPEAIRKCTDQRRHLCSMQELFAGGLQTARASGWLAASSEVWSGEDEGEERFDGRHKLGLCCED